MNYILCKPSEATHVRVTDNNSYLLRKFNLTENKIYSICQMNEPEFDDEEMILNDDGSRYICSPSLYIDVEWLKEN